MKWISLYPLVAAFVFLGLSDQEHDSVSTTKESVHLTATSDQTLADTILVAPPTGMVDHDRSNVQAAFDSVKPGDTILFSPGKYMLGAGAKLTVPDVTVLGHPDGNHPARVRPRSLRGRTS